MTRYIFLSFFALVAVLLISMASIQSYQMEPPYFLRFDQITFQHSAEIDIEVVSTFPPTEEQLKVFEEDYLAIWAHLNYIHYTNDLKPGKDRFTERFYENLAESYTEPIKGAVERNDISHEVFVQNWSRDGLACHVIDSAAVLNYKLPSGDSLQTQAIIAMALYFQGDNWRLDAMKIIEEKPLKP
ncbi:hypothetical protein SAMN04488519_101296 [Algoriphagus ornithinivorans]|uniref:Uncharacterized protein n=1 Tax=Algoriphagus ornithinivorans TaxID=226506 RepID=A0A1I5AW57_9BACT|nr:hypothetical protein [Algoriphagus ornithinivorans]SFN66642.1 hypothetical protein SAMN04488519_101296 [Algoriphagus ornithinivorans]